MFLVTYYLSRAIDSYTRESVGSFDKCMRQMKSFNNPRSIQHLSKELGLSTKNASLMTTLRYTCANSSIRLLLTCCHVPFYFMELYILLWCLNIKSYILARELTTFLFVYRNGFRSKELYRSRRKAQLCRWAHKYVTDGIIQFKEDNHIEAFQLLKKALGIDPENVEAFVAKGAL